MFLADRLTLDAPTRTSGGFLAVRARAARVGVYQYLGSEVDPTNAHGLRDAGTVNVLRDENTVFDTAAARSFVGKPITDNHPAEPITKDNWRDHARGTVMGAMRDGEYLAFDLLVTDGAAIAKIDAGKRELSNGYEAALEYGSFTAADGTICQARQTSIRGNHVAIVDQGRAGPACRIADAAHCDSAPQAFLDTITTQEKPVPKIILVDGLSVDVSNADVAESTIKTVITARDAETAKVVALETKAVTDAATIVAKDAEIAKLTADVAAAKLTPQQMRDAGKAYAVIVGKAKASGVTVTDEMDEQTIMKAVVDKAMPGNTYAGDHVAIAFAALTKDAKVEDANVVPIGMPVTVGDAAHRMETAWASENHNAWRTAGKRA